MENICFILFNCYLQIFTQCTLKYLPILAHVLLRAFNKRTSRTLWLKEVNISAVSHQPCILCRFTAFTPSAPLPHVSFSILSTSSKLFFLLLHVLRSPFIPCFPSLCSCSFLFFTPAGSSYTNSLPPCLFFFPFTNHCLATSRRPYPSLFSLCAHTHKHTHFLLN